MPSFEDFKVRRGNKNRQWKVVDKKEVLAKEEETLSMTKKKKKSGETDIMVHPPVELVSESVRQTRNCPRSYLSEAPMIGQAKLQGQTQSQPSIRRGTCWDTKNCDGQWHHQITSGSPFGLDP